jgi:hypothetical protein
MLYQCWDSQKTAGAPPFRLFVGSTTDLGAPPLDFQGWDSQKRTPHPSGFLSDQPQIWVPHPWIFKGGIHRRRQVPHPRPVFVFCAQGGIPQPSIARHEIMRSEIWHYSCSSRIPERVRIFEGLQARAVAPFLRSEATATVVPEKPGNVPAASVGKISRSSSCFCSVC